MRWADVGQDFLFRQMQVGFAVQAVVLLRTVRRVDAHGSGNVIGDDELLSDPLEDLDHEELEQASRGRERYDHESKVGTACVGKLGVVEVLAEDRRRAFERDVEEYSDDSPLVDGIRGLTACVPDIVATEEGANRREVCDEGDRTEQTQRDQTYVVL